ncbi:DUF6350 family protein [Kocuria sp.]|uniref:cell division protein PerM n=1 Tax=Kocuria sp. TaxID=1871328 RepID=UPI0026E03719|nr:DUF6350 family protein [Kocuria sp.]MDO5366963.1 DUF6350 family protein [Kocuria sp.]
MNFPTFSNTLPGVRERSQRRRNSDPGDSPTTPPSPGSPQGGREGGFPMPLWLQGVIELMAVAAVSLLLTGVVMAAVWLAGGFDSLGVLGGLQLAGQVWLVAHCTPLTMAAIQGIDLSSGGGTLTLVPLGLTLIPFALSVIAGRRIARACWRGQFLIPFFAGMVSYALIGALVALVSSTEHVSVSVPAGAVFPLIPAGLGTLVGGWSVSRSLAAILGADAASWIQRTSQYSRWAGSYLWAVVRAGFLSAVAVIAAGALVTAVTLVWNWDRIIAVYQQLGTGAAGDTALTALQFGYLPNMVVWAAAWVSGAGFSIGEGALASPFENSLGALPQFPPFAALPEGDPWVYASAVVVLPVLAGVLAGWWFLREGENHLDDWMAIRLPMRWFTFILSTLLTVAFIAAIGAGLVALLAWLSHGSLGLGRLTDLGPNAWHVFLWTGAEITAGGVIGYILGPWLEREGYRKNPWNSSLEEPPQGDSDPEDRRRHGAEVSGAARAAKVEAKQARKAEARQRRAAKKSAKRKAARLRVPGADARPDSQEPLQTGNPAQSRPRTDETRTGTGSSGVGGDRNRVPWDANGSTAVTAQEAGEAEPTTADGAGVAVFDSGWADSGDSADAGDSDAVGDADGVGPGDDSPGPVSNSVPER